MAECDVCTQDFLVECFECGTMLCKEHVKFIDGIGLCADCYEDVVETQRRYSLAYISLAIIGGVIGLFFVLNLLFGPFFV